VPALSKYPRRVGSVGVPPLSFSLPALPAYPELEATQTDTMDSRLPETDALLRIASALILGVDRAMDRLLSLLPTAARAPAPSPAPVPEPRPKPDRAEDIAIQQALDEVLEYHRTHRPKNTTKNYGPKQREWKVGAGPPVPRLISH
jgi:hypothetical protein